MDYSTDSDIDDWKYMPTGNVLQNQENAENFENIQNIENIDNINNIGNLGNLGVPNENQLFLQSQLMNLENDIMIANKTLMQLESENDQLKEQLIKNQEKMQSKEGINNEFKQLFTALNKDLLNMKKEIIIYNNI